MFDNDATSKSETSFRSNRCTAHIQGMETVFSYGCYGKPSSSSSENIWPSRHRCQNVFAKSMTALRHSIRTLTIVPNIYVMYSSHVYTGFPLLRPPATSPCLQIFLNHYHLVDVSAASPWTTFVGTPATRTASRQQEPLSSACIFSSTITFLAKYGHWRRTSWTGKHWQVLSVGTFGLYNAY